MIKRLPLNMFAVLLALFSFTTPRYFEWGLLILIAISIGLWRKHMLPTMQETLTIRGLATWLLFTTPAILAPVVLWGPYTIQGIVVDQSFSLILGMLLISASVVGFIQEQRND